jgi:predicted nucleic acid-binding protein
MKLVIDASVTVKWLLRDAPDEAHVNAALAILKQHDEGQHEVIQPPHWFAEVLAVMARRGPENSDASLVFLHGLQATIADDDAVYLRAAELSRRLKHHLFDTLYHAVALERGATLVTADEHYFNVAKDDGAVQLLKDFAAA